MDPTRVAQAAPTCTDFDGIHGRWYPYTGRDLFMRTLTHAAGFVVLVIACGDSPAGPAVEEPTETIRVYFTRGGAPQPVVRAIFPTFNPLPVALGELLEGPTDGEPSNGYTSFFHAQTASAFHKIEIREDSLVVVDLLDFSRYAPGAIAI